jgi:hypothetical protein
MKLFIACLLGVILSIQAEAQQITTDSVDLFALSLEELMDIPITSASKFEQSIKDAPSTISIDYEGSDNKIWLDKCQ